MEKPATDPTGLQTADDSMARLNESFGLLQQQYTEILDQMKAMNNRLSALTERESELRAVLQREVHLDPHMDKLVKVLSEHDAASQAATAAIDRAPLTLEPFPYAVIDDLLPKWLYRSLVRGIPPRELFIKRAQGKEHLNVPFTLAPLYCNRVWRFMAEVMLPQVITPRILDKFRTPIDEWIASNWPDVAPASLPMHGSGGRIMVRGRGYRIMPHRDPKWGFVTCILYLARPKDSEAWGTQIYAVDGDQEAASAAPYWINPDQCRLIEDVAFKPNRLLVFLNSTGAHGAHIPEDAQPPTLERYMYQFRVGPPIETIAMLKSLLPEERQPLWSGKALVDY